VKNYQVVVGGIGVIYDGDSRAEAHRRFKAAIQNSKKVANRMFGKAVTIFTTVLEFPVLWRTSWLAICIAFVVLAFVGGCFFVLPQIESPNRGD
jgi:hypothetical protein